jgi:hypothetical protein
MRGNGLLDRCGLCTHSFIKEPAITCGCEVGSSFGNAGETTHRRHRTDTLRRSLQPPDSPQVAPRSMVFQPG